MCQQSTVAQLVSSVRMGIEGLLVRDSCVPVLCSLSRHIISCLVLVPSWKTGNRPDMTEKLLTGT